MAMQVLYVLPYRMPCMYVASPAKQKKLSVHVTATSLIGMYREMNHALYSLAISSTQRKAQLFRSLLGRGRLFIGGLTEVEAHGS